MHMHETQNRAAILQPHDQLHGSDGQLPKLKINFLTISTNLSKPFSTPEKVGTHDQSRRKWRSSLWQQAVSRLSHRIFMYKSKPECLQGHRPAIDYTMCAWQKWQKIEFLSCMETKQFSVFFSVKGGLYSKPFIVSVSSIHWRAGNNL